LIKFKPRQILTLGSLLPDFATAAAADGVADGRQSMNGLTNNRTGPHRAVHDRTGPYFFY